MEKHKINLTDLQRKYLAEEYNLKTDSEIQIAIEEEAKDQNITEDEALYQLLEEVEDIRDQLKSWLSTRIANKIDHFDSIESDEANHLRLNFNQCFWLSGEIGPTDIETIFNVFLAETSNNNLAGYDIRVNFREETVEAYITDYFS